MRLHRKRKAPRARSAHPRNREGVEVKKNLKNLRVLVTAGPTREYFDPVRFLSNPSSGKMGYAIAEEAARRGAKVTLISGPVHLQTSPYPLLSEAAPLRGTKERVSLICVTSAEEMYRAVMKEASKADIIIMAAAVADYRPARFSRRKLKKKGESLAVTLIPTKDVLKELGQRKKPGQILVGFAAETDRLIPNALKKLRHKNLDLIVANQVGKKEQGFESETNRALLISSSGRQKKIPLMSKKKLAGFVFDYLFATPR